VSPVAEEFELGLKPTTVSLVHAGVFHGLSHVDQGSVRLNE